MRDFEHLREHAFRRKDMQEYCQHKIGNFQSKSEFVTLVVTRGLSLCGLHS